MIEPGVVIAVDRDYTDVNGTRTGQVRARLQSGVEIEACYAGTPPWPLATALFDGPGEWFCLGPIGDKRVAFADDFNYYTAGTPLIGNTGWTAGGDAGGSLSTPNNPTDGNGVLRLTNTTAAGNGYFIRKTLAMVTLASDRCYWMSARVRPSAALNGFYVGLADTATMTGGSGSARAGVFAILLDEASGTSNVLYTRKGGTLTTVSTGEYAADDTWTWVDVMVVGGQWAAMWVDGSGPWVNDTAVPGTGEDSVTPFISCQNIAASTSLDVDYVELSMVTPVNNPDEIGIPAVPFL